VIERAEKQIILAQHGRRLLSLLDDSPVTPGDDGHSYQEGSAARQILNDAEDDLRKWEPDLEAEPVSSTAGGMATSQRNVENATPVPANDDNYMTPAVARSEVVGGEQETDHVQTAGVSA